MTTEDEITELAQGLQFMVIARRRMRMTGDTEGAALLTRYFKEIDKIDPRLVASAENSVAGCGVAISNRELEEIKASVHQQIGDAR